MTAEMTIKAAIPAHMQRCRIVGGLPVPIHPAPVLSGATVMRLNLSARSVSDYERFLRAKSLPRYSVTGTTIEFPDEYASLMGERIGRARRTAYVAPAWMFDYQRAIAATAISKRRFAVFADCGLGKTAILLDFARHAAATAKRGRVLIVSPLMVIEQTIAEAQRFYGDTLPIQHILADALPEWLRIGTGIAITNYEAITDDLPDRAGLAGLILDESSMLKSHYGAWGTRLIRMGRGVGYKLCLTGTPAPNDRIEYANHAVFLEAYPTVNAFLARFFVNRGQTAERWELKAHAVRPFYASLSHWCIFLTNPAVYGWKDNCGTLPPIHVHIEQVPLTIEQRTAFMDTFGSLFMNEAGGIGSRGVIARIGKGYHEGRRIDNRKTQFVADRVASWPDESTIVWCKYNQEQEDVAAVIPGCANISGDTPLAERQLLIDRFKAGQIRVLVTKPKILGFGLNLQRATRQVFSGLQDSYEEFYQAVKRSNRYGATRPLNVHIPVTELETPMVETVLAKAGRVQRDTEEQERCFHDLHTRR